MARRATFSMAAGALCIFACTALSTVRAKEGVELADGTILTLPATDSITACPDRYNVSEKKKYTCIRPGAPGLLERVKGELVESGYIQYDELRIWSEFCNSANAATVLWIRNGLSDYASATERRTFIETAPVAVAVSYSNCDEILVQDSTIADELGLAFEGRVRVRDTYRDDEAERWVYGYSESAGRKGFAFFPEFGRELQSFNKFRTELARIGFEAVETNPQLGGQGFCRNDRDAIFITGYEDDAFYFRQFDYISKEYRASDLRLEPLLVQYFPDTGCKMFHG